MIEEEENVKKIWKYAILLVALSALLCMSAFAADGPEVNNFVPDAVAAVDGKEYFTATYTGQKDAQYLILMLAAETVPESQPAGTAMPDPTKTKILYVNQAQADAEGVVSFETVYPMALEDSVIWLTGGTDGPVALASVTAPAEPQPTGVTVSGTAASWNSTDDAVYLLYADTVDDATIKAEWKAGTYNAAYTGTKGTIAAATVETKSMQAQSFSFAGVANGTYKLAICKPGKYVPKIVTITVSGSNVDMGQQKLWLYGDVNYDGSVKSNDAAQINRYVNNKSSVFDSGDAQTKAERTLAADVNTDGSVKSNDAAQINRYVNNKSSTFSLLK